MRFPITGGDWVWYDAKGRRQRTGFNPAVNWVEATFSYGYERGGWFKPEKGPYVRIQASGYLDGPEDGGALADIKARGADLVTLTGQGLAIAENLAGTYAAAKGVPGGRVKRGRR